jgi:hypothetical protein
MTSALLYGIGAALLIALMLLFGAIKIVNEYERGVIFRLGRVIGAKGPGLFFIIPLIDRMRKVNLQTVTFDIPPQDVITKDNVTLRVNAVTYFNVVVLLAMIICLLIKCLCIAIMLDLNMFVTCFMMLSLCFNSCLYVSIIVVCLARGVKQ